MCGSTACCLCLSLFLLLFFLLPRNPSAVFRQLQVNDNDAVVGRFQFKNNNFYEVPAIEFIFFLSKGWGEKDGAAN